MCTQTDIFVAIVHSSIDSDLFKEMFNLAMDPINKMKTVVTTKHFTSITLIADYDRPVWFLLNVLLMYLFSHSSWKNIKIWNQDILTLQWLVLATLIWGISYWRMVIMWEGAEGRFNSWFCQSGVSTLLCYNPPGDLGD